MIVTAINNYDIHNLIKQEYGEDVYKYDLSSREDVIDLLEDVFEPCRLKELILIVNEELNGEISFFDFIKKIREISNEVRIICVLDKLSDDKKRFLFSNEIFDILEGNLININEIRDIISSDKKIIYKQNLITSKNGDKIPVKNEGLIIQKELIAIYGTSGAGKSFFSTVLAKALAKKVNIKVALLDMDIQNPCIDIIANVNGDSNTLSHIVEDVDKRNEISDIISNYMIKDSVIGNLDYMTSNVSLFEIQNKLSPKYYEKIYNAVSKNYQYTIIDLPASPFFDIVPFTMSMVTKLFFVMNPTYISVRQAIKYLNLITMLWNIPKDKIFIVINKEGKNSLSLSQIQSLLSEYGFFCTIPFSEKVEGYINGEISDINTNFNIDKIYEFIGINIKCQRKSFTSSILRKVGSF